MKLIPILSISAACLLAASCASPSQLDAERRQREYEQDHAACVNYGAVPNSPAFTECMNDMAYKRYGNYDHYRNYPYAPAAGPYDAPAPYYPPPRPHPQSPHPGHSGYYPVR